MRSSSECLLVFCTFFVLTDSLSIGKLLQVPDKDPTLKSIVYKLGLPNANAKIRDEFYWVPVTTQFGARRITVMNQGKPYSTWSLDMLLQQSNCKVSSTSLADLPGCKPESSSSAKALCHADVALFDGDYASAETEVYCSKQ